jgi:glycosyltransferase involved in cell wall biosynthesis
MKILFLSRWYPYPPDNGSKIRVLNLLRGLCEQHEVTLISFFNPEETLPGRNLPSPSLADVKTCPYREYEPRSPRALLGYLNVTPRYLVDTRRPEMEALIRRAIQKTRYDLVIASQVSMAVYCDCFQGIPAIFEEAELGLYRPRETRGTLKWSEVRRRLTWAKHRRFMARLLENFSLCTVVSEEERKLLALAAPGFKSVQVIPNSIDVGRYQQKSNGRVPGSLIFTGSLRYLPNYDAMKWFLYEIFPAIRAEMPEARLTITGDPGHRLLLPTPNVELTGRVRDVHSMVASSAVSLAPLRNGGGTRLKILESMALGTPVVATSKAAEGLQARDAEHLLIADTARDFAQAVLSLLRESELARNIAENALKLVQNRYDWRGVLSHFMSLVDQAATPK